jgi:hypothetical protein
MGYDIYEKVTTKLHYKDVVIICVALTQYIDENKELLDDEVINRARRLSNRLFGELDKGEPWCD